MNGLFGNIEDFESKFAAFWAQGVFRKLGKTEARRSIRRSVKTESDWRDLYEAHEAYKIDLRKHPRPLLHGSTFCNQWRDFLELEPKSAEHPQRELYAECYAGTIHELTPEEEDEYARLREWAKARGL